MLYWKSWLETRRRFTIAAIVMTILTYVEVINSLFASEFLHTAFLYCVLYLGLGGLHRERKRGTSSFTLALPVKRGAHVAARAAVGFIETVVLALITILIATGFNLLSSHSFFFARSVISGSLVARITVIWIATGMVAFALSLVLSNALTSTIPYTLLLLFARSRPIVLLRKIDASNSSGLDFRMLLTYGVEMGRDHVLLLPFPTSTFIFILVVAGFLIGIAFKVELRQDI